MAQIVLGLGCSHSPHLSISHEHWADRGENDKKNRGLVGLDGKVTSYEDLLAKADVDRIAKEITPEKFKERHERNQKGIAWVSQKMYQAELDALLIVGDDQQDYILDDNMPGISLYWGKDVLVRGQDAPTPATGNKPLIGYSMEDTMVPVASGLGKHLIQYLVEAEFDVGSSRFLDPDKGGRSRGGIGHAFGMVYNRVMTDKVIPTIPVMVNTYYPPNQPTPKRCYDLGRTLRSAVEAWPEKARVGVLASGGMSHFVVDEELDHMAFDGMRERSISKLSSLPRDRLESGSSEIRNWIVATGVTEHLDMELYDYVPCYRSPAGTGCAMGFAQWS